MPDRTESSVLVSLRALRDIEADRTRDEAEARRAAAAAADEARREAEARALAEVEARQRAIAAAEAAARAAVDSAARDERIRIETAERRARVEAQARLDGDRLAREMQLRVLEVGKRRPTGLVALAAALVVVVSGLAVFAVKRSREADAAGQAARDLARDIDAKSRALDALTTRQDALIASLWATKNAEDAARAEAAIEATRREIAAQRLELQQLEGRDHGRPVRPAKPAGQPTAGPLGADCDPSDPLGCLDRK